ncbi:complement factor H like 5 isoform X2 [Puntigrus tetrazona]|uniref:complement factor H like 5 isoform X2 n=1 Tax=Puntigrus tetrazona TaxID=1606681 RepID=UPI001C8A13C4|nr:complement factor H like 5 isoform X2 [Puntigrus tetrazona]
MSPLLLRVHEYIFWKTEVTCEEEQLIKVDILIGHPGISPPYKPGHILVFRCTNMNLKMQGQQTIECLSNGKWNYPYPRCEEVRCLLSSKQNNMKMELFPDFECPVKPGYNVTFSCNGQGQVLTGQREITCQSNGKWSSPFPTCKESTCEVPLDQHVFKAQENFRGEITMGSKHIYSCESGYEKMAEEATCTRDGWTPNPLCAVMTGSGRCGSPPQVNNADTVQMTKNEYSTGERVEYSCFNKYTMDQQHPYTRYLTCQQGQWTGIIKCLKPCTVTKEIMDERGIDLAYSNHQKMFAEHNDHITFDCLPEKSSLGIKFRQKCNDGEIILPLCV